MTPELLKVRELCQRLRIGRTKAHQLISSRKIASLMIGRQIFIPESAVIEFLQRSSRPVFDGTKELSADGQKRSAIEKVARRKAATSKGAA